MHYKFINIVLLSTIQPLLILARRNSVPASKFTLIEQIPQGVTDTERHSPVARS